MSPQPVPVQPNDCLHSTSNVTGAALQWEAEQACLYLSVPLKPFLGYSNISKIYSALLVILANVKVALFF